MHFELIVLSIFNQHVFFCELALIHAYIVYPLTWKRLGLYHLYFLLESQHAFILCVLVS